MMKRIIITILGLVLLVSCSTEKQLPNTVSNSVLKTENTTTVELNTGMVLIPGLWKHLNFEKSSGQQYLSNTDGVIIAVAQNPKKAFSFYEKGQADYETIQAYTKWDIEFQKENNRETKILKEDSKMGFQIWKFKDEKSIDNVFLYGNAKDNILNLLVYTNSWTEQQKIEFLESVLVHNTK